MAFPSHHKEGTTDTTMSTNSSPRDSALLASALEQQLVIDEESPNSVLARGLSIRSLISTTSSFARTAQKAANDEQLQLFREIGMGSCGVVFEQLGTNHIAKRALSEDLNELWNDFSTHVKVSEAFSDCQDLGYSIRVPRCMGWRGCNSPEDKSWWSSNGDRFPVDYQFAGNLLFSERILPLPPSIRRALIELYCKPAIQQSALDSTGNKNCLVRLYLGRRRQSTRPGMFFTLKNFKLHLDQMEQLNLDTESFAKEMAFSLAVLHWRVEVDGRDVEFVLGSEPNSSVNTTTPSSQKLQQIKPGTSTMPQGSSLDFQHRTVNIWLLDFNQCRRLSPDHDGILVAVDAFFINDPYYPRPSKSNKADHALWEVFRQEYLRVSQALAPEEYHGLASEFISRVQYRALTV